MNSKLTGEGEEDEDVKKTLQFSAINSCLAFTEDQLKPFEFLAVRR